MIAPDLVARAIAELEDGASVTGALQILRLLTRTYPVPGLTVERHAIELEALTHAELALLAALSIAQNRICLERLQIARAEMTQLLAYDSERPTDRVPPPDE